MDALLTTWPPLLALRGLLMCPPHTLLPALSGPAGRLELGCPHVSHDGERGRQAGDATQGEEIVMYSRGVSIC